MARNSGTTIKRITATARPKLRAFLTLGPPYSPLESPNRSSPAAAYRAGGARGRLQCVLKRAGPVCGGEPPPVQAPGLTHRTGPAAAGEQLGESVRQGRFVGGADQ